MHVPSFCPKALEPQRSDMLDCRNYARNESRVLYKTVDCGFAKLTSHRSGDSPQISTSNKNGINFQGYKVWLLQDAVASASQPS